MNGEQLSQQENASAQYVAQKITMPYVKKTHRFSRIKSLMGSSPTWKILKKENGKRQRMETSQEKVTTVTATKTK